MKYFFLIRGLPGSGKSTLATLLAGDRVLEADQFFETTSGYVFEPTRLPEAHQDCMRRTESALSAGHNKVAVANTFTKKWEMDPYLALAQRYGYQIVVCHCGVLLSDEALAARCAHGVSVDIIRAMRERWEF